MALVGVELETLVLEPDAHTTRPNLSTLHMCEIEVNKLLEQKLVKQIVRC